MKKFVAISLIFIIMTMLVSCSRKDNGMVNNYSIASKATSINETTESSVASSATIVKVSTKTTGITKTKTKKSKKVTPTPTPKTKKKVTPIPKPTATPKVTKIPEKKYVALTFDDGPNTDTTPLVLDKLEKYKVVASFFLCGQNLSDAVKPVMERQLELGCEINNHSWSHPNMSKMTQAQIEAQVEDTNDKIFEMVGVTPKFFRPPFIATSVNMYKYIDLPFICGIGCNDWDANVTTQKRAETIIKNVKNGDIILLHDGIGNTQTVDALDTIIPTLLDEGYEFVTVSKLFEIKGVEPNVENVLWTNVK